MIAVSPAAAARPQPWMRVTRFQDQDIAATESIGARFDNLEVVSQLGRCLLGVSSGRDHPPGRYLPPLIIAPLTGATGTIRCA